MGGFQFLDHTGDIGILATGDNLKEAFTNAALGMFAFIVDLNTVEEVSSIQVEIESNDQESLLVNWLNELNYRFETENFLCKRFQIDELSGTRLKATCFGEPIDLERHHIKSLVKAATYHLVKVSKNSEWQVQVILDI